MFPTLIAKSKKYWILKRKNNDIMVPYRHEDVDIKLLTIHPLKEGQKENRIQSGRWRKI